MRRGRPRDPNLLTPREQEVLSLLREGLSNKQIASRLGISESGARYHVSEILSKLGVNSREEAAALGPEALRQRRRFPSLSFLAAPFQQLSATTVVKGASAVVIVTAAAGLIFLALGILLMSAREPDDSAEVLPVMHNGGLGKIAYVQDGNLWAKALPDGQPIRLTNDGSASYPRWSASGEWILMGGTLYRDDGNATHNALGCHAWSPVEDLLACASADLTRLVLQEPDGSRRIQIEAASLVEGIDPDAVIGLDARWSPDGSAIAYVIEARLAPPPVDADPRYSGIWLVNSDGGGARELLNNQDYHHYQVAGQLGVQGWAPDGSGLVVFVNPVFSASIPNDGLPLYYVPIDAGAPLSLTGLASAGDGNEVQVALPRNELSGGVHGQLLVYTVGGWRETWTNKRIAVASLKDGRLSYHTSPDEAAFSPSWSPDGSRIVYAAAPDIGAVGGGDSARQGAALRRIWVMDLNGANRLQLTHDERYRDERPLWSRDGSHILFARIDNLEDVASLWILPMAGGSAVKVADISHPPNPSRPLWFGFYGYVAWDSYFEWWQGGLR